MEVLLFFFLSEGRDVSRNDDTSWSVVVAMRRHPTSKVRNSGCALLEQP